MKRGLLILAVGLIAAVLGYCCVYDVSTASARSLERGDRPELAWLQQEFNLSEAETRRASELHAAYLPGCREMCRQIDAQNQRLRALLANATDATPEMAGSLAEAARLRAECQTMMLHHFFQVAESMPPEQGRRYLSWVKEKVFLANYGMTALP